MHKSKLFLISFFHHLLKYLYRLQTLSGLKFIKTFKLPRSQQVDRWIDG